MSTEELIHAYRKLFRAGLRAAKFSKPARFVVRDQLRTAFREGNAKDFDPDRVKRTVWFLTLAAEGSRLEHKIVQNLVRTQYTRQTMATSTPWKLLAKRLDDKKTPTNPVQESAFAYYDMTIKMLNDSLGLCLR